MKTSKPLKTWDNKADRRLRGIAMAEEIRRQSNQLFENLDPDELLTTKALAQRLSVNVRTIKRWVEKGFFPKVGSRIPGRSICRYRWGDVESWLRR